jgi:hypothetical protein
MRDIGASMRHLLRLEESLLAIGLGQFAQAIETGRW